MKKMRIFSIVAMICILAVGCTKDSSSFSRFLISSPIFNEDGEKVVLNYSSTLSKLIYEDGDVINVNGVSFTLSSQGDYWVANRTSGSDPVEAVGGKYYIAYADNASISSFNESTGSYLYDFSSKVDIQPSSPINPNSNSTNGMVLAGSTTDSLVKLNPACAIIRMAGGSSFSYVKVGFEANKVPVKGTVLGGSGSATITNVNTYLEGVTAGGDGKFLYMTKCNDGWYVAVPVFNGGPIVSTLYFEWNTGSETKRYKTQAQVQLNNGYVYSVGSSAPESPFLASGFSRSRFLVAEGRYVRFSAGNLQYLPDQDNVDDMTGDPGIIYRFAEHQYDIIGSGNSSISYGDGNSNYIDLFGWGTSGWDGSGAVQYMPFSSGTNYNQYYTGSSIAGSNTDWGYYARQNSMLHYGSTVVTANARTLTKDEWNYLLARTGKCGLATINGSYKGLVLIPDLKNGGGEWTLPVGCDHFTAGSASGYTTNEYTLAEWDAMEMQGAIFLPATGYRNGSSVSSPNLIGYYWSTDENNVATCYIARIQSSGSAIHYATRSTGCAVRLVL